MNVVRSRQMKRGAQTRAAMKEDARTWVAALAVASTVAGVERAHLSPYECRADRSTPGGATPNRGDRCTDVARRRSAVAYIDLSDDSVSESAAPVETSRRLSFFRPVVSAAVHGRF
jgi:hypothetical protein